MFAREECLDDSMILIQSIHTIWTKASRGGRMAALRQRIPRRLPLPEWGGSPALLWHSVEFAEVAGFSAPVHRSIKAVTGEELERSLDLSVVLREQGEVEFTFRASPGAPQWRFADKAGRPIPAECRAVLEPTEWVSFERNTRLVDWDQGSWWYEHWTINAAVTDSAPSAQFFLVQPPLRQYSLKARLH
jgi:hypothetical protein